ncbi:peptidoglycan DD-metalloendopeptidase family protein [Aliidiomarina sp. Khilg15.8]
MHDFAAGSLSTATSYQVQPGDTLYSIAFRADTDLREIARLNNMQRPYEIHPGQVLSLSITTTNKPVAAPVNSPNRPNNRQTNAKKQESMQKIDLKEPVASNQEGEYVESEPVEKTTEKQSASNSGEVSWLWPSQGRIVQRFSANKPGRSGIVFAGSKGDSVTAAAAGKVVYVGSALRGFGRLIILKHNDDYITAYAHNDELLVEEGQWVTAGQRIATMGDSEADTVRLRFELRYRGSSVNPEKYLPRSR